MNAASTPTVLLIVTLFLVLTHATGDARASRMIEVDGFAMRVWTEGIAERQPGEPVVVFESGGGAPIEGGGLPVRDRGPRPGHRVRPEHGGRIRMGRAGRDARARRVPAPGPARRSGSGSAVQPRGMVPRRRPRPTPRRPVPRRHRRRRACRSRHPFARRLSPGPGSGRPTTRLSSSAPHRLQPPVDEASPQPLQRTEAESTKPER